MSRKAVRYEINITSVRIPPTLKGVRLPIEIIPQEGEARQSLISLEENQTKTESVESPGTYLIRAVLPSGQLIAKTIIIPQSTAAEDDAPGDVTLDFGGYVPVAEAYERAVTKDLNTPILFRGIKRYIVQPEPHEVKGLDRIFLGGTASRELNASLDYGLFDGWGSKASSESGESTDTLVIKPCAKEVGLPDSVKLPGDVKLARHPGWQPDSREWRPLLIRARFSAVGPAQEALIVYPPSASPRPLKLLPILKPDLNSIAPWVLAYTDSDNPELDLMFKYVRAGDLHRARQLMPRLVEIAQGILESKFQNPVNATLAAYVLLKVTDTKRQDWVNNLADWFEHLPDAAIIYGWYRIRAGEADDAPAYFRMALERGLPMYSAGVRLLRDGLNFLRELPANDPQVQADAARANRISDLTNFDSDLTCLRLGKGLMMKSSE